MGDWRLHFATATNYQLSILISESNPNKEKKKNGIARSIQRAAKVTQVLIRSISRYIIDTTELGLNQIKINLDLLSDDLTDPNSRKRPSTLEVLDSA